MPAWTPFRILRATLSRSFPLFFPAIAMSMPRIKKRCIQTVDQRSTETSTSRPEAGARTVVWDKAPEWQRDNKYIIRGYRPAKTGYLDTIKSLTFLHNETCNIYTHLAGALLLPLVATSFMQVLFEPRFPTVSGRDYVVLGIFFCSAECCLVFSSAYHLMRCYSHDVEQFWLWMDLLGIVVVTMGTSIPSIHYTFACEPSLQKLHCTIVRHICSARIAGLGKSLYANVDDRSSYWGPPLQF